MNYIVLDKISKLENISTVVSIAVILLLAITFGILFYLYYRYYSKCITHKVEDEYLTKEVVQENKKYFNKYQPIVNDPSLSVEEKKEKIVPLKQHINEKKRAHNRIKIVANTFLVVFYLVFVSAMAFAIHVKSSGELFTLFDKSCLIIQTGSMEEKNERNTYLTENNLDDQIATFSLITIEKVEQNEINLYDIIAFKDNNNRIIVHRIVSITEENGEISYMTRGDANTGSASYELNLTYDDIIGKYNGYQSFALGIIIFYFQSSIGIITLAFGLCLIAFYDVLDIRLGKKINIEKERIYQEIDDDILKAIENNEKINYVKINEELEDNVIEVEEEIEDVVEDENDIEDVIEDENDIEDVEVEDNSESEENASSVINVNRRTFLEKLVKADSDLKSKYNDLKNELMSYQMKARLTRTGENFRYNQKIYGKITIVGKCIKLYLALDPEKYANSPMPVKNMGEVNKYREVPLMLKIKSDLSLKRAKQLIEQMMLQNNISKQDIKEVSWYKAMEDIFFRDEKMWASLSKRKRKLFISKLLHSDTALQNKYVTLKNELLSYKFYPRISAFGEKFKFHGNTLCKLVVSGKTLKVYLALNPDDYLESSTPVRNVSDKKEFKETPLMIKVRSDLSLKRTIALIEQMSSKNEIKRGKDISVNHIDQVRRDFIKMF